MSPAAVVFWSLLARLLGRGLLEAVVLAPAGAVLELPEPDAAQLARALRALPSDGAAVALEGGAARVLAAAPAELRAAVLRRCYACDAAAAGWRDRRREGGRLERACTRHREPMLFIDCGEVRHA